MNFLKVKCFIIFLVCLRIIVSVVHAFSFLVQQATILREDLPGFIFESNRGTKHSFTAETSLGPEFAAGWTGKRGKRLRSKIEAMKQKVSIVSFL